MKITLSIVSILFILVGGIWFFQGINVIGGSSMTGHSQWMVIGSILFVIGVEILVFANRRRSSRR